MRPQDWTARVGFASSALCAGECDCNGSMSYLVEEPPEVGKVCETLRRGRRWYNICNDHWEAHLVSLWRQTVGSGNPRGLF